VTPAFEQQGADVEVLFAMSFRTIYNKEADLGLQRTSPWWNRARVQNPYLRLSELSLAAVGEFRINPNPWKEVRRLGDLKLSNQICREADHFNRVLLGRAH
jgi:hypothetical protein